VRSRVWHLSLRALIKFSTTGTAGRAARAARRTSCSTAAPGRRTRWSASRAAGAARCRSQRGWSEPGAASAAVTKWPGRHSLTIRAWPLAAPTRTADPTTSTASAKSAVCAFPASSAPPPAATPRPWPRPKRCCERGANAANGAKSACGKRRRRVALEKTSASSSAPAGYWKRSTRPRRIGERSRSAGANGERLGKSNAQRRARRKHLRELLGGLSTPRARFRALSSAHLQNHSEPREFFPNCDEATAPDKKAVWTRPCAPAGAGSPA
jgi:hypothetical protein